MSDHQTILPDEDLFQGNWTPSTGSALYSVLDNEETTNWIQVTDPGDGSIQVFQVGLADALEPSDPDDHTDHKIIIKLSNQDSMSYITWRVTLNQGNTAIRQFQFQIYTGSSVSTQTLTLSEYNASQITDYTDLNIEASATDNMMMGSTSKIYSIKFEIPASAQIGGDPQVDFTADFDLTGAGDFHPDNLNPMRRRR